MLMTVKNLTLEEFKKHCSDELELVVSGENALQLTSNGKVMAIINPAQSGDIAGTLADVIGSGCGIEYAPGFDPDAPACDPDEWEAVR